MTTKTTQSLIQRLETLHDVSDLYASSIGKEVLRDIERLARNDLPGAVRIWKDHAPATLQAQPGAQPAIIKLGALIESRFEGRQRESLQVPFAADNLISRAQPGNSYEGEIIGRTPSLAVMRQANGDLVLHRHKDLTMDLAALPEKVIINYPEGLGDMGITKQAITHELEKPALERETVKAQAETQYAQAQHAYQAGNQTDGKNLEAAGDASLNAATNKVDFTAAESGRTYEGPVREISHGRLIQRTSDGRFISHNKNALAGMRIPAGQSVQIRYPSGSRVGLVSEASKPSLEREAGMAHEQQRQQTREIER